jgi:predicted RNA-binding Zn-ribbon protein involved in translation (DUF1610 family)
MNDSINYKGTCDECGKDIFPINSQQIGKSVISTFSVGRGSVTTEYQHFQCLNCGSIWQKEEERGAGGHNRSKIRLTKGIY